MSTDILICDSRLAMMLSQGLLVKSPLHRLSLKSSSSARLFSTIETTQTSSPPPPPLASLTQKEYYIAIRNRLFAVEEQIWLHEYAVSHPGSAKVKQLSEKKYEEFLRVRGELLEEYPLTKLYLDLRDATSNNMTYAAIYLERLINTFHRQLPLSMNHVNQIAVLSFSGQVMNLMRGQGLVHQRLLPSTILIDKGVKRQFQHPVFSRHGKYIAFAELHFKETSIVRSDIIVYDVPRDPKIYGSKDLSPIFDSGELPGAPFFVQFSPDEESIAVLSTSTATNGSTDAYTSLMVIEWGKLHRSDSWAGQAAVSRFVPRKALSLLRGNPLFFTYTTSDPKNATIIAHCQKEVVDSESQSMTMEKAVWMLDREDTAGVKDFKWKKISTSDPTIRWPTPICHSAGGGDNVLVVENGYLVSKALSRWKRDEDTGKQYSKKLLKVMGQVQFLVSPDHSRAIVLQEDINVGHYSLTVLDGESGLDPASLVMPKIYEMPHNKLTVAFWFSPDSTKLLCLTAAGKTRDDVMSQKSQFRVGLNSDMEWVVYNFPLQEWKSYDTFKPTPYFIKTYVPFFSQYAQAFNPWAPDSRSFIYVTTTGLCHTPLVDSKYCVGMDKWQNQGATFGTWFRH
jgi:hypothetical protein